MIIGDEYYIIDHSKMPPPKALLAREATSAMSKENWHK
jgi:hypothetical protein